jgi:hypothetical protein
VKYPLAIDTLPEFEHRRPRIFVGICAFGDISPEAFESFILWWGATCYRYGKRFDLLLGVASRKEQYRARNYLIQGAEEQDADYLLMLDDDQIPHLCLDMIGQFADFGAPIMGGLYFQRGDLYHPIAMKAVPREGTHDAYRFLHRSEIQDEPFEVDVTGHGCMWVDMAVYANMKFPLHWPYPHEVCIVPDESYGLDVHFCRKVRAAGYPVYLLPGISIGHVSLDRQIVTRDNLPPVEAIDATERATQYWSSVGGHPCD